MAAINQHELGHFTGSEDYHRHWGGQLVLTEGANYLQGNGAGWLIDLIASHQRAKALQTPALQDFQAWEIQVHENKSATVTCRDGDSDKPVVTQKVGFTDFPIRNLKLWVELGSLDGINPAKILMLPSER